MLNNIIQYITSEQLKRQKQRRPENWPEIRMRICPNEKKTTVAEYITRDAFRLDDLSFASGCMCCCSEDTHVLCTYRYIPVTISRQRPCSM